MTQGTYKRTDGGKMKKVIENTIIVISFLFFLWIFASWANVLAHNMTDQKFAPNNFFVIITEGRKND